MTFTDPNLYKQIREDGRIVYHLGSLGPLPKDTDPAKPYHLGPYTDGNVSVPGHWWNARATDRTNCPLKIIRTPAQIIAANRMFPYGNTGCKILPLPALVPYTPMGSSNITIYMPTTGERSDIGLITDPSAVFMLGGAPDTMLAWAQSNDSCPLHFRDEATGKPIDLIKYPQANAYDLPQKQGSPFLVKGPPDPQAPQYSKFGGGWTPQQAHFCEMSYIAHMATDDAGFLESLQYNTNFTVLCDASHSSAAGAIISGETRGIAWTLRLLFMAHVATQGAEAAGTLPNSCHPSSYFKTLLDNALAYYSKVAADPNNQTFRLIGEFARFSPWTVDYLLTALAFGVLTGHSDWAPLYLWCLGNVIARTNGTSGYPPGFGTSYRLSCYPLFTVTNDLGTFPTTDADTSKPQFTWKQAFDALVDDPEVNVSQAQHDALAANPLNGGVGLIPAYSEYMMTTRAVLVMADYLDKKGLAAVRATYPDLDTSLANAERMFRSVGTVNARVSVVSDPSAPPVILPPLPPPAEPPPPVEPPPVIPPAVPPPVHLPATLAGIAARVTQLKTIVGVPS